MGRHSRKGRGDKRNTDTGTVPGIPAPAPSAPSVPPVFGTTDTTPTTVGSTPPGPRRTPGATAPRDATAPGRVPAGPAAPRGARPAADGTPARGVPRPPDGTPAHGMPRFPADGTPAQGTRAVRGGHPQQREAGGGWGELGSGTGPQAALGGRPAPRVPRQRTGPGPRQEYLDAFAQDAPDRDDDVFAPRRKGADARAPLTRDRVPGTEDARTGGPSTTEDGAESAGAAGDTSRGGSRKGRTFAGIAAAAVVTALAVVVAGQFVGRQGGAAVRSSATGQARDAHGSGLDGNGSPSPSASPSATPLTYEQAMDRTYPLSAKLKGPDTFSAVPGSDKAPGTGRKYTYRVDVEKGLGLDGRLFAEAVQKTLNDDRSWAHHGARTFARVSSGKPDFVITLASPGTTAAWCAKSGLDTTEDNVSCDSASTERVMINAYRWAQGSTTYGDKMYAYRQMLINHEVGHRLGYGHVTCDKDGELAPVMQQQTKFLDHDGIHCLPNPWPFPRS
ncbi:DUF3152 domain-containing protein [Streptomyces sp. NPDC008222]|uniref:DUF3152 domain-containing protein n=1 Tax=Streptomyces sp. NPDC008222 TaxID=3364820 RepID=UPI0036E6E4A2